MGKIIFKEMTSQIKAYDRAIKQEADGKEKEVMVLKMRLLWKTLKWVSGFSWLNHEETKIRVREFIKANCKYQEALDVLNTRKGVKEISYGAYKVSINYASDKLKELLGDNFVSLVDTNYEVAELKFLMVSSDKSLSHYVVSDVADKIKDTVPKGFPLEDCVNELYFLASFSKKTLESRFMSLDIEKLRYLKRLLEGKVNEQIEGSLALGKWLEETPNASLDDTQSFLESL